MIFLLTLNDLQRLSQITEISRNDLVDINDVKIDQSLPAAARLEDYISQIKNPYYFLCGNTPVRISFSESEKPLSEKLEAHFIRQKV